jgi:16S rRNA processing protein RimM
MPEAAVPSPPIVVGRVRKPHGLKGDLSVFPLTDDPDGVFTRGRELQLVDLEGKVIGAVTVAHARTYHRECLMHLVDHEKREAVEGYRGLFLAVPRGEMEPLAEGEVYLRDLIGWAVRSEADEPLGLVSDVYELPQGPVIEIQGPKREFLLPLRPEYVKQMDRDAKRVIVSVPEGLLE